MSKTLDQLKHEVDVIFATPAYPTAPDCPHCDFPGVGYKYAKTGLQHHIRKAHPDKVNNRQARIKSLLEEAYGLGLYDGDHND